MKYFIGSFVNGQEDGLWGIFHETGRLKQEEEWKAGKLWNIGPYINLRGDTLNPGSFKNGVGTKINYHPDNSIEISCDFLDGIPHGSWKYFYENGKIGEDGTFENGLKTGEWTFYYSNGKIESQGKFVNDKKSGAWIYFSRSGELIDKVDEDLGKSLKY